MSKWYITARKRNRIAAVSGPYSTRIEAENKLPKARYLIDKLDPNCGLYGYIFGVASTEDGFKEIGALQKRGFGLDLASEGDPFPRSFSISA